MASSVQSPFIIDTADEKAFFPTVLPADFYDNIRFAFQQPLALDMFQGTEETIMTGTDDFFPDVPCTFGDLFGYPFTGEILMNDEPREKPTDGAQKMKVLDTPDKIRAPMSAMKQFAPNVRRTCGTPPRIPRKPAPFELVPTPPRPISKSKPKKRGVKSDQEPGRPEDPQRWTMRYHELCDYRDKFGHCNVPAKVRPLGTWVMNQRARFKKGKLSQDRIQKLRSLDFRF